MTKMQRILFLTLSLALVAGLFLGTPNRADAAFKSAVSETGLLSLYWCQGPCVYYGYAMYSLGNSDYNYFAGGSVTLNRVYAVAVVRGGRTGPCLHSGSGAANTPVYQYWSTGYPYGTLYPTEQWWAGGAIYDPNDHIYGGAAYPGWNVQQPLLHAYGFVNGSPECLGWKEATASYTLP